MFNNNSKNSFTDYNISSDDLKNYELEKRKIISSNNQNPTYHIMPPTGWLNDPNGLCQLNGKYHVFFQYAPFYPDNSLKYWGHYESFNLTDWTYTGVSISPDTIYDKDGVYSGCSYINDKKMYLFYTGNVKNIPSDDSLNYDYIYFGRGANTMLVNTTDGINISEKNILMDNSAYPQNITCHVRDPKVWKENNKYYMVLGARENTSDYGKNKTDTGCILLYESDNLTDWKYLSLAKADNYFGYMWECPDLFILNGKKILSFSPQGLESETFRFQNQYQSGYCILNDAFDYTKDNYIEMHFKEWDYGFDFYAPQTFMDENGRRILIGWAGMTDCDDEYTYPDDLGWYHMLTMPRELILKNDCIYQMPVKEIQALRNNKRSLSLDDNYIFSKHFELEINNINSNQLKINISGISLEYNNDSISLKPDKNIGLNRSIRNIKLNYLDCLDIYVDGSIIEIYINNGEYVMTSRFFCNDDTLNISFSHRADNISFNPIIYAWDMQSMSFKFYD